jgi:lipopolysaccharide export system permease protein
MVGARLADRAYDLTALADGGRLLPADKMSDPFSIIDRYLGRNTIQGFLLVLSLLAVLFSFFELLVQLDYVGKGTYRLPDAFTFVALTIPKRLSDLMPMAALLGGILALGLLADHQELTAMQAGGVSVQRISLAVLSTSILLMLGAVVVSEFIAPPLDQYARTQRFQTIYGNNIMLTRYGFWARHGRLFVHVGQAFAGGNACDVEVFEFDEKGLLTQFITAKQGLIQNGKDWILEDAETTVFDEEVITQKTVPEYRIEDFLSPSQVAVLELSPDSLSLSDLYTYIWVLERRGQGADRYALAFWQKICLPVTIGIMELLSLTFIFGSTRMRNAWQRMFAGMLAGSFIYLLNQIFGQLSLVLHLPPLLMTLLPSGAILLVALRLLRRAF